MCVHVCVRVHEGKVYEIIQLNHTIVILESGNVDIVIIYIWVLWFWTRNSHKFGFHGNS